MSSRTPSESNHFEKAKRRHRVTIRDVAREAGVSETTVSLAFQPDSRISSGTRKRVLDEAGRLGYLPDLTARALRAGMPDAVGFVVNDITNPFYAALINSLETIARQRNFQTMAADSRWDPEGEIRAVENMIRARVRGMLICPCEKTDRSLELLREYSIPFMVVDSIAESYHGAFVGNDLVAAGRLAAEHLVQAGCRRMAFLTADKQMESFSAFVQLKAGFLESLHDRGIPRDTVPVVNGGLNIDGGRLGFGRLRKRMPDVDGIFCANDPCAIGAMEAADAAGLRVGGDICIVGIDDLDISATARISLTSIRQPYQRIVDLAANALIDAIEADEMPHVEMFLPPELIARNTTRRIP